MGQDANGDICVWIVVAASNKLTRGRLDVDEATRLYPMWRLLQGAGEDPEVATE